MSEVSPLHERLASRRVIVPDDEPDACDDCGAYGYLRGTRDRSLIIEFRMLNGNSEGFALSTLERVSYDPSVGLTLQFLGVKVLVRGRNLATIPATGVSLLQGLYRHRIPWIRECEEFHGQFFPPDAVVVTRIEIPPSK